MPASKYVCSFGPVVIDQRVLADPSVFEGGGKADVSVMETLGGGGINTTRAVRRLGVACRPLVLVGKDPLRAAVDVMLRAEFEEAVLVPMLTQTRRR